MDFKITGLWFAILVSSVIIDEAAKSEVFVLLFNASLLKPNDNFFVIEKWSKFWFFSLFISGKEGRENLFFALFSLSAFVFLFT